MKILINPKDYERGSGLTTFLSFDRPELKEAIKRAVRLQPDETMEALEIDEDGITVRLKSTPLTPNAELRGASRDSGEASP